MAPSEILDFVVQLLERLQIPYMITGSIASSAFGEPRFTNDVDIVVDLSSQHIDALVCGFPEDDFYMSESMVRDAVRSRTMFNVIHAASGMKVDFIVRKPDAFEQTRFNRRIRFESPDGVSAMFASPEDVILKKLEFYKEGGSEKHLRDIASILRLRRDDLDMRYIEVWSARIGVNEIWDEVRRAVDERENKSDHH
ncbi:MAG: hypothetical protein ACF8PN_09580 [Phycisphaerales bacterium]